MQIFFPEHIFFDIDHKKKPLKCLNLLKKYKKDLKKQKMYTIMPSDL